MHWLHTVFHTDIARFPLAEAQAAVVARVYSGRLPLPETESMDAWEVETAIETGGGAKFHLLPFPKDADYMNSLYEWAVEADKREGLENDGVGKEAARWGPLQYWQRQKFPEVRKAFSALTLEQRQEVKTLEELGFDFEKDIKARDTDL
jgi:hypothetical protein